MITVLMLLAAFNGIATVPPTQSDVVSATTSSSWMQTDLSADRRAELLLAQMTGEEKKALLFGYFGSPISAKNYQPPAEAIDGSAGYVPGIARLNIPPQWQTDAGIGVASQWESPVKRGRTALPSGLAVAATWNPELAREGGAMIGDEARASGFNVMLAGAVNLMRDPRNGRNFEYGGEDPLLAGTIVGASIAGIQSNHIISTIKHFALNDQETDRHYGNVVMDPAAARMSDLLAFELAIEASDPGSVMCAYNRVNGPYSCESPFLLTDVLRQDWGYKGYVMSDWGGVHSTAAAANAGLDQQSGRPFDDQPYFGELLTKAVAKGEVSASRIDEMAYRILRSMFVHGLFDYPVEERPIDFGTHADVTRRAAEEGIVLLKNADELLPLPADISHIAIIGGHADKGVLAGGGSSLVHPVGGNAAPGTGPEIWPGPIMYYPSSPMAEIAERAPHANVRFVSGADPAAAAQVARESDVAIVFATQWAGESFDVELALPDGQDALIAAVAAASPKTIVVLETGGPVLTPWLQGVGALLAAWYPGTAGGEAIANILFGRVNPSGRLPATFPRSQEQLPNPGPLASGTIVYSEGAAVGYRWYDLHGLEPQFAFGHGLSYTRFKLSGLKAVSGDASFTVRFKIRNTGRRAGAVTPQIYASCAGWEAPKRLVGWTKTALEPGESKKVSITVDPRLLAMFDTAANSWVIAPGNCEIMLANSSRDIVATTVVRLSGANIPAKRQAAD